MKSVLAIAAGFFSMVILEGFARIIIAFYHREDFIFSGIEALPSIGWIVLLLCVVTFLGVFGTLLTTTIAGFDPLKHTISLALLVILLRILPILFKPESVSLLLPLLPITFNLIGIIAGYFIKKRMLSSEEQPG